LINDLLTYVISNSPLIYNVVHREDQSVPLYPLWNKWGA